MSENFNELLSQMLTAYKEGKSIEDIIATQISAEGLSNEEAQQVNESVDYSKALSNAYDNLQQAKEKGYSRKDWLTKRLEHRFKLLDEAEQETAVKGIEYAMEKSLEDSLPAGEDKGSNNEEM